MIESALQNNPEVKNLTVFILKTTIPVASLDGCGETSAHYLQETFGGGRESARRGPA